MEILGGRSPVGDEGQRCVAFVRPGGRAGNKLLAGPFSTLMDARIDHVVLWVEDVEQSLGFYTKVLGLEGVRVDEFRAGKAPFPSVRVSRESILDIMPRAGAPMVDSLSGTDGSAGHPVNHVCLAMSERDYEALRRRLEEANVPLSSPMEQSFGAQGLAPRAFYFRDPDGNVLEARYY